MALTRRQFLTRTGLTAGGLFASSVWSNPFVRRAMANINDKFLVVLFLDGGNDGLNTVTPLANGTTGALRTAYQDYARRTGPGGLQLTTTQLNPWAIGNCPGTGTPLALHPGLEGLWRLHNSGNHLAVIQNAGYPDYTLSHELSRQIWQAGQLSGLGTGWVGRHLAQDYVGSDIPGFCISGGIAGPFIQGATSVLAAEGVSDLSFPYDPWYGDDDAAKRACFDSIYSAAKLSPQPTVAYTGNAGSATLLATDAYPSLDDLYLADRAAFDSQYEALDNSTARRLREVAKVIYGVHTNQPGVNARFFHLNNGGYDTHSNQGGAETGSAHYDLHREIGDAIEVFYHDVESMGIADKVLLLVYSEFSRRIEQNDNGTDHGSQGPMFIVGGAVNGGIYGSHPDINESSVDDNGNTVYSQDSMNPHRSTDMRDVYGTIFKHWLGMSEATILNPMNPVLSLDSGDPNLYWTAKNFDLGFI